MPKIGCCRVPRPTRRLSLLRHTQPAKVWSLAHWWSRGTLFYHGAKDLAKPIWCAVPRRSFSGCEPRPATAGAGAIPSRAWFRRCAGTPSRCLMKVIRPIEVDGRASALRFRDGRVQALFQRAVVQPASDALLPLPTCEPCWLNCWVSTRPLPSRQDELRSTPLASARTHRAHSAYPSLRTHHPGIARGAVLLAHLHPALATDSRDIAPNAPPSHSAIRAAFERLQILIDQACQEAHLATG